MQRVPPRSARHAMFANISHVLRIAALAPVVLVGCHTTPPVDTKPLDAAGMSYPNIKQLQAMDVTATEVAQLADARQAGFSDAACVQMLQLYRTRNHSFDSGDTIAGLLRAGMSEDFVVTLARLDQLGLQAGELQAMRLAGLSEPILMAVAQHHAANQPVLSGASLAGMKNLGVRSDTLYQLVQRSVPDSDASSILKLKRRGATDAEILRQYSGS